MDLRLKDEMVKIDEYDHIDEDIIKARIAIEDWQKTLDANKAQRNKDFLDEYAVLAGALEALYDRTPVPIDIGKQVDWDKVEEKELEERKEFHKSV